MFEQIHATFEVPGDAERAAGALLDNGLRAEDLTIIQPQTVEQEAITYKAIDAAAMTPEYVGAEAVAVYEPVDNPDSKDEGLQTEEDAKFGLSTTTPGDAGIGAAKGAGWGLGLGALAALASVFIPGVGLVIGGGALATAIGAAAATTGAGAVAGAVTGYLKDQGFEEADGRRYEKFVENGGAILSLSLPSGSIDAPKAWEIIDKYNGVPLTAAQSVRKTYLA
jgi:hypothetical protein